MLTTLLIIATLAYFLELLFLRAGLRRADRTSGMASGEPTVSIIVAARNEEQYIEQCLQSLIDVDYPKEKLQIVIVNDRSTDGTAQLVLPFTQRYSFVSMVTTSDEQGNLRGKTNAVSMGIEASTGDILMFTDADCTVPKQWVRQVVRSFEPEAGVVGGYTFLDAKNAFEGMQSLDWVFLFSLASSTAGWRIPLTAIGNNLSVRRSAYDLTGGYTKIPFSVTEDYSLVQAIIQSTKFQVRFPVDPQAVVTSHPCRNWRHLFRQKQRWGVGGLDMVTRGIVIMSIGWIVKFLLVVGAVTVPFDIWSVALLAKFLVDIQFLWLPLKRLGKLAYIRYFLVFEVYFTLYVLLIPFIAILSKKIVWKERTL